MKVGLCDKLEGHALDYSGHRDADTMRVSQAKIQQYIEVKYGEDLANEIKSKVMVVLVPPPKYSDAIK